MVKGLFVAVVSSICVILTGWIINSAAVHLYPLTDGNEVKFYGIKLGLVGVIAYAWEYINDAFLKELSFLAYKKATSDDNKINTFYYKLSQFLYFGFKMNEVEFNKLKDRFREKWEEKYLYKMPPVPSDTQSQYLLNYINWIQNNFKKNNKIHQKLLYSLSNKIIKSKYYHTETNKHYQWLYSWVFRAVNFDILTLLIENRLIDVNARVYPALHVKKNVMECIRNVLKKHDIDPRIATCNGQFLASQPIALCATLGGNYKLLQYLISYGANIDDIFPSLAWSKGNYHKMVTQRSGCSVRHAIQVMAIIHGSDSDVVQNLKNAIVNAVDLTHNIKQLD